MQLKLSNIYVKDIWKNTKTDIYDETVIYVILIHGCVEDCQLRKVYKAPFLIPITCHQVKTLFMSSDLPIDQQCVNIRKMVTFPPVHSLPSPYHP